MCAGFCVQIYSISINIQYIVLYYTVIQYYSGIPHYLKSVQVKESDLPSTGKKNS